MSFTKKSKNPAKKSAKRRGKSASEAKSFKVSIPKQVGKSRKFNSPIHEWLTKVKASGLRVDSKIEHKHRLRSPVKVSCRVSDELYAPADTSMAKEFVDLNTVYRFRLGGHTTIGFSSGVLDEFFACDPSASGLGFPEWTTLTALFSEFKLVSLTIQFVRQRQAGSDYNTQFNNPVMIAGNLGTASAPGSYANLADNADACFWAQGQSTSDRGYTHTIHGRGLNWSIVSTPTVEPYAGAPGSIQLYGTATSGVPTDVIHCLVAGVYDFRSRV